MGDTTEEAPAIDARTRRRWPAVAGVLALVLVVVLGLVLATQSVDRRVARANRQRLASQSIDAALLVTRADLDGQEATLGVAAKTLRAATKERDTQAAAVDKARGRVNRTKDDLDDTRTELEKNAKRLDQTQKCLVRAAQVLNQVAVNDFFGLAETTPKFQKACDPVLKR